MKTPHKNSTGKLTKHNIVAFKRDAIKTVWFSYDELSPQFETWTAHISSATIDA